MKHKISEWLKRYIPAEIVAALAAVLTAVVAQRVTDKVALLAIIATLGEVVGFYSVLITRDLRKSLRLHEQITPKTAVLSAYRTVRNAIVEFGFSEVLDIFLIRPATIYFFTTQLGNLQLGVILGKITADVVFYIPTVVGYEFRKKFLTE
ncbi:MAG: hypothetical protein WEC84_00960 [Candidatus Andersenbacteria bacterium]